MRDGIIMLVFITCGVLFANTSPFIAILGFVLAYIVIYTIHEWGHLLGARVTNSQMPLAPYRGALIGYFDPSAHSKNQFLALSWGGVIGYLIASTAMILSYFNAPSWFNAGAATAGLAFTVQSLAVDLPQILKVHGGADPTETNQAGTQPQLILKRTWQTWVPLGALLTLWNVA